MTIVITTNPPGATPPSDPLGRCVAEVIDRLLPELEVELEYFDTQHGVGGPMQATGMGRSWSTSSALGNEWVRSVLVQPSGSATLLYGLDPITETLPHELSDVLPSVERAAAAIADVGGLLAESLRFEDAAAQEMVAFVAADRFLAVDRSGQIDPAAARSVMNRVLVNLERLAVTRVEKRRLSHGVLIARSSLSASDRGRVPYPEAMGGLDRVPLVFDGEAALLWIDEGGLPIAELNDDNLLKQLDSTWPQGTSNLPVYREQLGDAGLAAAASDALNGMAFYLRADGAIWVFANGVPFLFNRTGRWRGLAFTSLLSSLSALAGHEATARLILNTALLLSMTGHGGILGVTSTPEGLTVVPDEDRYDVAAGGSADPSAKAVVHRLLDVGTLSPRTLARLAAMDGATVVSASGQLIAYGSILSSPAGGGHGSREAAAAYLSTECDVVLKISEDGPISLFLDGQRTGSVLAK